MWHQKNNNDRNNIKLNSIWIARNTIVNETRLKNDCIFHAHIHTHTHSLLQTLLQKYTCTLTLSNCCSLFIFCFMLNRLLRICRGDFLLLLICVRSHHITLYLSIVASCSKLEKWTEWRVYVFVCEREKLLCWSSISHNFEIASGFWSICFCCCFFSLISLVVDFKLRSLLDSCNNSLGDWAFYEMHLKSHWANHYPNMMFPIVSFDIRIRKPGKSMTKPKCINKNGRIQLINLKHINKPHKLHTQ